MPRPRVTIERRMIIGAGAGALLLAFAVTRGHAATTIAHAPSAPDVVTSMDARIATLERRVAELEAIVAANPRVEATTAPSKVQAPFIVVDADNKTLLRVDRSSKTGFARLTVGDTVGAAAALVAAREGGVLQLVDAADKVRLAALASNTRTGITTFLRAGKTFMGGNEDGLPVFQARNLGEIPVAELKAMVAQDGQLVLTNEAGDRLVVAGVSTKGTGVVKTGPGGNGPAATLGEAGLPASEIQGRKKP